MCVSTVDPQGLPEGRFVDLKTFSEDGLVFCTRYDSRKGLSLAVNPCAALTFWWDHIERQVRIVGPVQRIADAEADRHFQGRPRDAQLTMWASHQSAVLNDPAALELRVREMRLKFADAPVPRPAAWGGYRVNPSRMEFLTFKATRDGDAWRR